MEFIKIGEPLVEWFNNAYPLEPDASEEIREIRERALVQVRNFEVWSVGYFGVCARCSYSDSLNSFRMPRSDYEEGLIIEEHLCRDCVSRMFAWYLCGVGGYRFNGTDQPIPVDFLPLPEGSRTTCGVCDRVILKTGDNGYRASMEEINATQLSRDGSEPRTISVHRHCSFTCNGHGGCSTTIAITWQNGNRYRPNELTNGDIYCDSCFESRADDMRQCDACGAWGYPDSMYYSDYREAYLCSGCEENNYVECGECGDEYREGRYHECDQSEVEGIYYYSYKPTPRFYGKDRYHFGIELEMEGPRGDNLSTGVEILRNSLGDRVYLKEDSSINYGFEMVTHPHSLVEFQKEFNWSALARLVGEGYRSWDTTTCGLHVHVSRTAFEDSYNPESKHILKFVKFIYDNQHAVQALAGRESSYAKFSDKGKIVQKLRYGHGDGHFSAVNTEPEHTLEIRVFRGSLKPERVLSAIEFVHAAVEHTRTMKVVPKERPMAWTKFIAYLTNKEDTYPHLIETLERTLNGARFARAEREE